MKHVQTYLSDLSIKSGSVLQVKKQAVLRNWDNSEESLRIRPTAVVIPTMISQLTLSLAPFFNYIIQKRNCAVSSFHLVLSL